MGSEKVRENRLRRQAKRLGLELRKSRARRIHLHDLGGYRLVDPFQNSVVAGERFDLDLDEVEEWLAEYERSIASAARAQSRRQEA